MSPDETIKAVELDDLKFSELVDVPPYHYGVVFERILTSLLQSSSLRNGKGGALPILRLRWRSQICFFHRKPTGDPLEFATDLITRLMSGRVGKLIALGVWLIVMSLVVIEWFQWFR